MILPRRRLSIHTIVESMERTFHNNANEAAGKGSDEKKEKRETPFMPAGSAAVGRHPSLTDSSHDSSRGLCEEEHFFRQSWEEEEEETDHTVPSATQTSADNKMEETTIVFGQEDNHSDDEETTIVFGDTGGGGGQHKADLSVSSKLEEEAGGEVDEDDALLMMNRLDYAHDMLATMNVATKGKSRRATMHGGTGNSSALNEPPRTKANRRVTYASATGPTPMWMDNTDLDLSEPIGSPDEEEKEMLQKIKVQPHNLSSMKRRSLPAVSLPKLPSLFPASMATSPTKLANEIRRRKSDIFDRRKAREAAEAALREERAMTRKQKEEEEAAAKRRQAEAERQRQQRLKQQLQQQQQKAEEEAAAAKTREAEQQQRQQQQKAEEEKMATAANAEKWAKATGRKSRRTRSTTVSASRQDLGSIVATRQQATRRKSTPVVKVNTTSAPKHEENSAAAAKVIATATATTPRRRRSTATSSRQDLAAIVATRQQATRMKSTPVMVQNNAQMQMAEKAEKAAATTTTTRRRRSTTSYTRGDLSSIAAATAQASTRRKSAPVIKNNDNGSQLVDNKQEEKAAPDAEKVRATPVIFQNSKGQSVGKQVMVEKEEKDAGAEKKVKATRRRSRRTRSTANSSRQDLAAIVATKQVTRRKSAPVIDAIDEIDEDKESQFVLEETEAYQKALTTAEGKFEATVTRTKPAAVPEEEEEEEEELDEDIRALKERIAKLECKLQETTAAEETEIKEIQQETENRKEEFRTQKGLLCNKERATLMLNTVKRGVTLRAMKRIIADVQGSNRNYRMVIRNLSANLEELYEQKHELQQSMKWARIQSMKNSTKMGDQENHYFGLTEHLPDYRHWIDGLRKEQVRRNHLIQYEKRMLARYNETMDVILSRIFQTSSAAAKQENDNHDGLDNSHQENDFLRAIRKAANTKKHAKAARKAARRHSKSSRTIVYEYITRKVPPQEGTC